MPRLFTNRPSEYRLSDEQRARILSVTEDLSCEDVLELLQLESPLSNLVIIGGASNMAPESLQRLANVFEEVLAPLAERLQIAVLDGGTDAGVIQMMGQARRSVSGSFRLLGVAPRSKVRLPDEEPDSADDSRKALEPNHTDFCLVPGEGWGSESPWLAQLASTLAASQPSVTLLINGGKIALVDLRANLETGRPAIVLAGSGRTADAIATAITQSSAAVDPGVAELVDTYYPQKLSLFDLSSPLSELTRRLERLLMSDA